MLLTRTSLLVKSTREMLVPVALVAFACFITSTEAYPLSHEDKGKLLTYHTDCLTEAGVDELLVAQFTKGKDVKDAKLKQYLFCMSKKTGFQNEEGKLQIDVIKAKLPKIGHNETEINALVEKCAVQKECPSQTAYDVFKCYKENVPSFDGVLHVITITPVKIKIIFRYRQECIDETKLNETLLDKAHEGEFPQDPSFSSYLLCLTKKLGLQDANGKIQKDAIKELLKDSINAAEGDVDKLLEVCVSEKETPEETAQALVKCFAEKTYIKFLTPFNLPTEKVDKLFAYHKQCRKQTSVNRSVLLEASLGNFTEDPALKLYFLCMSKKVCFQNEEGVLQTDVLKEKVAAVLKDEEASRKLLEKCAVQKESAAETAYSTVKCYFENTPNHISIFQNAILSAEKKQKLSDYNAECLVESNLDAETLEQVKKGTFPATDDGFKKHLFCFFKKLGIQSQTGELQIKRLCQKFGKLVGDPALSEKLAEKCGVQMESPAETAYKTFACYYENSPSRFNVFALF